MGKHDKSLLELMGDIEHYCIVVADIEAAVKYFSAMGYQFEDIHIRARSETENLVTLRGKPISYKLKAAVARNTTPFLELTEVVEGEPTQKEFLESRGHSVHHVCYYVPDVEAAILQFEELGIEVIQRPVAKHQWAMVDTKDMCGYYIELHE